MARILAVGNATLDIVSLVEAYPPEDAEVRAITQRLVRGGNAANTLVTLSQLGHRCSWAGTLANDADSRPILDDFARYGIDTTAAHLDLPGKTPVSYVTLSRETGSRTIVHYRDLPEYGSEDFRRIDLSSFDWLHLEGRNVAELASMLDHARFARPQLPVSLEIEKRRPGMAALFDRVDVLLFSRAYANQCSAADAHTLLHGVRKEGVAADLVCAWGEAGAYALDRHGLFHAIPAFPPPVLVDTLGAGDVFNAGIIDATVRGESLAAALVAAARLAGFKCGRIGLDGLGRV